MYNLARNSNKYTRLSLIGFIPFHKDEKLYYRHKEETDKVANFMIYLMGGMGFIMIALFLANQLVYSFEI